MSDVAKTKLGQWLQCLVARPALQLLCEPYQEFLRPTERLTHAPTEQGCELLFTGLFLGRKFLEKSQRLRRACGQDKENRALALQHQCFAKGGGDLFLLEGSDAGEKGERE